MLSGLLIVVAAGTSLSEASVERFARLALDCVHQEYPNKIAHVLNSAEDASTPSELTPAFYGCYDWHSSVHGHWLLARLIGAFPEAAFADEARAALRQSLSSDHIAAELRYLEGAGRATFERPYGLAWLLQLAGELRRQEGMSDLAANLEPLETLAAQRFREWLPKLLYPIRTGEHSQSAFALGLVHDWARLRGDVEMLELIERKARAFHSDDPACVLAFEPSGQDFLSPCLAEADLMRRVLEPGEFAVWLRRFLPQIPEGDDATWLPVAEVSDRSDGKLAHLDGLNLSRAWMLEGIAAALPADDERRPALSAAARVHRETALAAVDGAHYEGGHWLGSFATYLVTGAGLP